MQLQFLGAATTVTGSQYLLTTARAKVLIDCGMFQGSPREAMRNRVPLAYDPKQVDALLLTHAHLDHCGLIPLVVHQGFRGPIFATAGTQELTNLVLLDSAKLQGEFAQRGQRIAQRDPKRAAASLRREELDLAAAMALAKGDGRAAPEARDPDVVIGQEIPSAELHLSEALYDEQDVLDAMRLFRALSYDTEVQVAAGVWATFRDAGHILGSAMIRLRVREDDASPERIVVFSGDVGRCDTPIIRDPSTFTDADYLLLESTYGGREHEPADEARRILRETVQLVAEAKGVLLVPSFAIGRTQELVFELDRLLEQGQIPRLPLYLDSPMASKATDIYRGHAEYFDDETKALLARDDNPLDYPGAQVTNTAEQSKAIRTAARPYMVVASNGMLTGGRVLFHVRDLIGDVAATILFVGYQGEGTLGAELQAGAKQVRIEGQLADVRCQVKSISGFSAHADESELLDWASNFTKGKDPGAPGYPRILFVVHGDPDAQAALAPKLRALGFDTHIPIWRETVTLT